MSGVSDGAALVLGRRRNILEFDFDRGNALRNRDMEGEDVERVAHPLERLAVGGHPDTRDILDVAARAVAAGDPLWVKQNEIAGARHRHAFVDTENSTRDVAGVDRQLHRPGNGMSRAAGTRVGFA